MSHLTFYIMPAAYQGDTPEELAGDYSTWWDAHDDMMHYCQEHGVSPSKFWIEELEVED